MPGNLIDRGQTLGTDGVASGLLEKQSHGYTPDKGICCDRKRVRNGEL